MGIKYIFFIAILLSLTKCQHSKIQLPNFLYCTKEQSFCARTTIDTANLIGNHFQHFQSYTSIMEYDTFHKLGYEITWGNCKPDIDWGPFTNYTYDTLIAKKKLNMGYYNEPIYFMKVHNINDRKFITICNEMRGMGIIAHSNYYSDSLNILIQTTYINQFDYKKIDFKKHFEVLENTEIYKRE